MGFKDKAVAFSKKFKLDSHHAIERFGVFFSIFAVVGVVVLAGSGASAYKAGRDSLSTTAVYTESFTTSKTELNGNVDGVYTNKTGDRALVMMHFDEQAKISYSASDYQAFLLGSDTNLNSEAVGTDGIEGKFYVFGSTGYLGILFEADQPFDRQVLNLTVRSNAELSYDEDKAPESDDDLPTDETFSKYDQWRVFINPGASEAKPIPALNALNFDPARAYYDIVVKKQEKKVRAKLDDKLVKLRTDLAQIESYTGDLETTKVDGLFLRPPSVPKGLDGDEVVGQSASESDDDTSTLRLKTPHVVPGGFDFNWRAGNVYDGYLDAMVPSGKNYAEFLSDKREEAPEDGTGTQDVSDMKWTLSDGSDLKKDYQSSDVTMRPLINVMNNLSQAYQDYSKDKSEYQSDLMLDLLRLDIGVRDVQSNSSVREDQDLLTVFY